MSTIKEKSSTYIGEKPNGTYDITVEIDNDGATSDYIIFAVKPVDYNVFKKLMDNGNGFKGFNYLKGKYKVENTNEEERYEVLKKFDELNDMIKRGFKK